MKFAYLIRGGYCRRHWAQAICTLAVVTAILGHTLIGKASSRSQPNSLSKMLRRRRGKKLLSK